RRPRLADRDRRRGRPRRLARTARRPAALPPQPRLLGGCPGDGSRTFGGPLAGRRRPVVAALTLSHLESLSPRAQELAARIAPYPWAEECYLAGSAALALYIGHRPVQDLDLMSGTNRLTSPERRDLLGALLALDPDTEVETARDGYLRSE